MPKNPKSTKHFDGRAVGYMVTDAAGNQRVIPFVDSEERLAPTGEAGGLVPPLPTGGGDVSYVLVYNNETNNYSWVETTLIEVNAGAVMPLVDGSEPPVFITDGAGTLIAVDYTP